MQQTGKIIVSIIITALVAGGGVYAWTERSNADLLAKQNQIVKYNCEQSGGKFTNNKCACPSEFGKDMYDPKTGYCQTTNGGEGGEIGTIMNELIDCRRAENKK